MREDLRPDTTFIEPNPFDTSLPPIVQHISVYMGPRFSGEGANEAKKDIENFLYAIDKIINKCYLDELEKQPDLKGMLNLKIILYRSGKVKDIIVGKNSIGETVEDCVLEK
jgi:hypothetical protein